MPTENRAEVERIAEALYQHAVERAIEDTEKVQFDVHDMPRVFKALKQESETGQVLVFGSYLEDRISQLLKVRMKRLTSKSVEEEVFGAFGPLGSFGSRILLCHQLGWLTDDTAHRLKLFKSVRNEFAHRAFRASLSDPAMEKKFKVIGGEVDHYLKVARDALGLRPDGKSPLLEDTEIQPATHNLCSMAMLAEDALRELLILPICLDHRIDPHSLDRGHESSPSLMVKLVSMLSAVLVDLTARGQDSTT